MQLIDFLKRLIENADSKNFSSLMKEFDNVHISIYNQKESLDKERQMLVVNFIDAWFDVFNHNYEIKYAGLLDKNNWLDHAKMLLENLQKKENVTDKIILDNFSFKK